MDTIGNMLISLLNAQRVGKARVAVPYSKLNERLLALLKDRHRIADVRVQEGKSAKLLVTLAYEGKQPALHGVRRISKPGGHQYITKEELPYPTHGEGFYIVSTSHGVMDERRARKEGLGGELMCEIW